jgi:hypothetical protein
MKWVTWENIGVDRMGSAWLIRKYIDPEADFLFIPVAQKSFPESAEPFDIPGVRLSHHQGRCTFHTILDEYQLRDLVLQRIARIIDEADVVQEVNVEATAPGLDLICRGLRLISSDDQNALERGMMIYDALYAQLAFEQT